MLYVCYMTIGLLLFVLYVYILVCLFVSILLFILNGETGLERNDL
jgi:hypothetical protein